GPPAGPGPHQNALTWGNGSAQAWHRQTEVQAVAPKTLTCSVRSDPQRGQVTAGGSSGSRRPAGPAGPGGAMPAAASFSRPAGVIQSVVHGGCSVVTTSTCGHPPRRSAAAISDRIVSIAGQAA